MTTTADEKIEEAKHHIKDAYSCLLHALDEDTWGSDEFKDEYIEELHEVALELLKLKRKIK